MENNGDSGNQEFQPDSGQEDLSTKTNGYSTGNEEFQLPFRTDDSVWTDDQSMRDGYSTGNEEFQLPSVPWITFENLFTDVEARPGGTRHQFHHSIRLNDFLYKTVPDKTESLPAETRQDLDSIRTVSATQLPQTRGHDGRISHALFKKRETDKAYRRRWKETQEKTKEERDNLKAENKKLKLEIEALKSKVKLKDEQMEFKLETHRNEIKEKERQMETLAENLKLKLGIVELEKRVMKAEIGRLEAEKKLLQKELAIANQSSQTQSRETAV